MLQTLAEQRTFRKRKVPLGKARCEWRKYMKKSRINGRTFTSSIKELATTFDAVVIEDLDMKGMSQALLGKVYG